MTFTVTYRGKDGGRSSLVLDVPSKADLWPELKKRGISALSVKEGGAAKRGASKPSGGKSPSPLRGIVAGGVVVALAVGAWLFLSNDKPAPKDDGDQKPKKIKEVKPSPPKPNPMPVVEQKVETPKGPPWPEKSPHPDGEWRHGEGPRSIAVTNGCLVTYPHYPGVQMILPHPAFAAPFETLLDNEIARIISAKPGDDFIDVPLPKNFDDKFAESLLVPIKVNEDDTPEKAELKKQVLEARKVLVEAVKRGESPRQILEEEAKSLRRLMQTRDNFQRIVNEQIQNGATDQEINDTVNAANKMLEREGIDGKVMLPWKTKLRLKQGKAEGTVQD